MLDDWAFEVTVFHNLCITRLFQEIEFFYPENFAVLRQEVVQGVRLLSRVLTSVDRFVCQSKSP